MNRILRTTLLAAVALGCSESIGPKPPSAKSAFIEVLSAVSKANLGVGDTLTWTYSLENITTDSLTLTTNIGCQLRPELDQVQGPTIPDLLELICPPSQTVRKMAAGEKQTFSIILRGYDKTKSTDDQKPGYLLTSGTFDASVLVTATELGVPVRSDWVRFKVDVP